jgi:hypothetical protein
MKQSHLSTTPLIVSEEMADLAFAILAGKRTRNDSHSTRVDECRVSHCGFCLAVDVVPVTTEMQGRSFDATVTRDEHGICWADFLNPHDCEEVRRFREHLDSPSEPEFYEEEEDER